MSAIKTANIVEGNLAAEPAYFPQRPVRRPNQLPHLMLA